ncbi:substrate import-associated zinc metallohydrolase lipoprotein [Chitinophaga solisilvae]|uniref:Substrate import-associated zinc metallohydrolase lipoprotein n=1 Tax=Chitinophaga solisilvae TaxID=1233460 RepID=A0A9Q5GPK5_9BACT|nr:substrate import-associated zinc metallohydrolase lipoprotein [Chitinophaga solisilvae]NSL85837.1 hypothetical protein [Chitinophaga solisilvae]
MNKLKILLLLMLITIQPACNKKDNLNVPLNGLGGDTWVKSPIDKWLYDSLTVPLNIEVKYKWDQSEFDMAYTLVPPAEAMVIPTAQAVLRMWIEPYNKEAGTELFMKQYASKVLVLSGSPAVNSDGSSVQGLAEGGLKILLFSINSFNQKDSAGVYDMAHLLHHEFTHILNQQKAYPITYKSVTPDGYTGGWTVAKENPLSLGYISNYARKEPGEDIAEMVSWMMVLGKAGYEDRLTRFLASATQVNRAQYTDGVNKLRQKEALIVQYFRDSYNLDFYSLQSRVQAALKAIIRK